MRTRSRINDALALALLVAAALLAGIAASGTDTRDDRIEVATRELR